MNVRPGNAGRRMTEKEKSLDWQEPVYAALEKGDYVRAAVLCEAQLGRDGNAADAQALLTSAYIEMGASDLAEKAVQRLLQLRPQDAYAQFLSVRVKFLRGERLALIPQLEKILQTRTDIQDAYQEKLYNLLGQCWRFSGDAAKSSACYRQAVKYAATRELKAAEYSNYLFNLHYRSDVSSSRYTAAHQQYNQLFSDIVPFLPRWRTPGQRLRIGYISPDFRHHVVWNFSRMLFTAADKEKFAVYGYANCGEDEYTRQLAASADGWRNIRGLTPAVAARLIYEDGIDILFDLSGHTSGSCLPVLAYKPAPVQLCGIGYFATTGLQAVDYFLGDSCLDGDGEVLAEPVLKKDPAFTEQLLVLPHSHLCYYPAADVLPPPDAPCRQNGFITFGSFNNFTKITDDVLDVWRQILQQVSGSRLFLKGSLMDSADGRALVFQRLQEHGIDSQRVLLEGFSADYMSAYRKMDIALDTFPYPGGGTTCDALYMGVPVVSLAGAAHGMRFGYSLLHNAGLPELCARTVSEYIDRAVLLAFDPDLLNELHHALRSMLQQSSVMDAAGYMRQLEDGYRQIWVRSQQRPMLAYRDIPRMAQRLRQFAAGGDLTQALAAAGKIWAAGPEDRRVLEEIAAAAIDAAEISLSQEVVRRLLARFGSYGYGCFLAARAACLNGDWRTAQAYGEQALAIGDLSGSERGMVFDVLGRIARQAGNARTAADYHLAAARSLTDPEDQRAEYSNYLLDQHSFQTDGLALRAAAAEYNVYCRDIKPQRPLPYHHDRLRIGYVSPDFCQHVMGYFCQALLHNYDRNCFEVFAYASGPADDRTQELAAMPEHWRTIRGWSADAVDQQIRADEIDILVDLAGHTKGNLLAVFARQPAPVQVSGLGYMSTTGLQGMDYFLSDRYLEDSVTDLSDPNCSGAVPAMSQSPAFTEQLLVLPHSHLCYVPSEQYDLPQPAFLLNGWITFGSFNHFTKVTDEVLAVWSQILTQVPESRLFLKAGLLDSEAGRTLTLQRLQQAGIDVERVFLEGRTEHSLAAYAKVDIALDTFPYTGGATTCDALYMGVPVITLAGTTHGSRFGRSLLYNVGLADCCAASTAEYIELAMRLAADRRRLFQLHQVLRRHLQQSWVMSAGKYMADLEWGWFMIAAADGMAEEDSGRVVSATLQAHDWSRALQAAYRGAAQYTLPPAGYTAAGFVYLQLKDYARAEFWLQQALTKDTENDAVVWQMLGEVRLAQMDYGGSAAAWQSAYECLQQSPVQPAASFLRSVLLNMGRCAFLLGEGSRASVCYLAASKKAQSLSGACSDFDSYLLSLHLTETAGADLRSAHDAYAALLADVSPLPSRSKRHSKLRIGYLSPDFRQHVMFNFYYILFASFDRQRFTVYGYQLNSQRDHFTDTLMNLTDQWREVSGREPADIAQQIAGDEIDILFDLAGHSADSGLPILAWKPAPVQISGLGYMDTTGLPAVDYYLTDRWVVPDTAAAAAFSERPLYLTSQFCYVGRSDVPQPQGTPAKKCGYIVFGVFNHYYKVTDSMLQVWKEILRQLPTAQLLLKSQEMASAAMVDLAYERLWALGMPMERIQFEAATADYMTRYLTVDIALDTYPWPGGGTTCDALYMGVPVISLYGERAGSRFGLSILQQIGLGELAVADTKAYIDRAVGLAQDGQLLDLLHGNLRRMLKKSPLMNASAYMHELEQIYQRIVRQES